MSSDPEAFFTGSGPTNFRNPGSGFYFVMNEKQSKHSTDLKHDRQHGHVIGVPRVGQLVKDGLLHHGWQIIRMSSAKLPV